MKKYSLTGLMLFVLLAFIPSSGHAVGRLNFMLTNLTGLDSYRSYVLSELYQRKLIKNKSRSEYAALYRT